MKVLHLIDHAGVGGAQTIARIIGDQVSNSELFYLGKKKSENLFEKYSLSSIFYVHSFLKKRSFETLHCHLFKSKIYALIIKIFFYKKVKLIFHEHSDVISNNLYQKILCLFQKKVKVFVAVSEKIRNQLLGIGISAEKIHLVKNCVYLIPPSPEKVIKFIEKQNIDHNLFNIIFVGRLHKDKGCELLLKAASKLNLPFKIYIAGEGAELKRLEALIDNNHLENKVLFLGNLKEVELLYSVADLLVAPSKSETFGLVALEAQLFGVPVIVSKSFKGVVSTSNAIILKENSSDEIVKSIEKIYNSKELRETLMYGGYKNVKKYSKDKYKEKILDIYNFLDKDTNENF